MRELGVLKAQPYAIASALSHTAGFVAALAEICVVFVLAPLLVGSHLLAVADSVPVFDVKESCQGREIGAVFAGRNSETCIQSEEAARDQLKKSWGEFPAKDKVGCVATTKIGGLPSYIELITCLEINRDLDKIRATSSETPEENGTARSHRKRR